MNADVEKAVEALKWLPLWLRSAKAMLPSVPWIPTGTPVVPSVWRQRVYHRQPWRIAMSTHPNTILMGVLIPDELARKTYRAIVDSIGTDHDDPYFNIGNLSYSLKIMEDSYDDSDQISAPEGSIVAHCFLTYGYGVTIAWSEVEKAKTDLEAWLANIAAQHKCSHSIHLTANYW